MRTLKEFKYTIEQVFAKGDFHGPKSNKALRFRNAHTFRPGTRDTYVNTVKSYANWVYRNFGKTDAHFLRPVHAETCIREMLERAKRGELQISSVMVMIHALTKYQEELRLQQKYRARIINKTKMLALVKETGLKRSPSCSTKGGAFSTSTVIKLIQLLRNSSSEQANISAEVLEFQWQTGSRISAVFRVHVKDVDFESGRVTFYHDKGNKTRTVSISPEFAKKLQEKAKEKKSGRMLFELKGKSGNLVSIRRARQMVEYEVRNARNELGLKRGNTHSFRKRAVQDRVSQYKLMSMSSLQRHIIDLKKQHKHDRFGRVQIPKRIDEMAKIIGAEFLGHSRVQIMRWYMGEEETPEVVRE